MRFCTPSAPRRNPSSCRSSSPRCATRGCTHVIMEVSSHALVLHRADQIPFSAAVFTNLTEDHLDFHQDDGCLLRREGHALPPLRNGRGQCRRCLREAHHGAGGLPPSDLFRAGKPRLAHGGAYQLLSDRVEFDAVYQNESGLPSRSAFPAFSASITRSASSPLRWRWIFRCNRGRPAHRAQSVKGRGRGRPHAGKDYTVLIDYSHTPGQP